VGADAAAEVVARTLQRARSPASVYLWARRLKPALYGCDRDWGLREAH